MVQNGEIFNYVELAAELRQQGVQLRTASDTEVILRLYEREGIACLRKLNGMFAIAIDDAREDALYLARDRIGVKPLYVADDGGACCLRLGDQGHAAVDRGSPGLDGVDVEAIHHYLSFNYIPAPWTIWRGVRHVMPGTWMKFTRARRADPALVEPGRAARAATSSSPTGPRNSCPFWTTRRASGCARTCPGAPSCRAASTRARSSALMARHVDRPVKTFCIGFADPRYDESAYAAEAARRFGCEHTSEIAELNMLDRWPQVLYHLDQPHGDASFMPTLRVSELAARHVKVVLTGDGGDELFAGYDKYADYFAQAGAEALRCTSVSSAAISTRSRCSRRRPSAISTSRAVAARLQGLDSFEVAAKPWFDEAAHFDRLNQALYLDMQLLLSGNNLVKPDRMGMAVSIEARTPFLDWRMMEFAFRSRGATKLHGGDKKHWYKRAVAPADRRRPGLPQEADVHGAGGRMVQGRELSAGCARRCEAASCCPGSSSRR